VAAKATDLGGGLFRYEIRGLTIGTSTARCAPSRCPPAADTATDFYFHDIDDQVANDWVRWWPAATSPWSFPDVELPGE